MSRTLYDLLGLLAAILFIMALKGLSSPKSARRGNLLGALGAFIATVAVFFYADPEYSLPLENLEWILGAIAIGVIVDLAAESGGNVEGSVAGEVIETAAGVRIWGGKDVPSQLPFHASSLYSKNLVNLMGLMIKSGEAGSNPTIALDFEDEIIAASAVTHAGEIRNEQARAHIQGENAGKSS